MRKENLLEFAQKMWAICPQITVSEISEIVRIARRLDRLNELEAGTLVNGREAYLSFDEQAGKYYRVIYDPFGNEYAQEIRNPYRSIEKKLTEIAGKYGIYFYHQTDPRGCPLYVSDKTINYSNYLYAIAVPV